MNLLRGISGRSYEYSSEDQVLTTGDLSYRYDVDGFLAIKNSSGTTTTYEYATRGELMKVTLPDGKVIEYINDPLGRRIAKKVNGIITEKYLWQGHIRLLAVYDSGDNLIERFIYADSRLPVAMQSGGNTYYLSYDQVGSLRLVTDSSGNVIKALDYDSFGNLIQDTNPSFDMPFGFAGGLYDPDTSLIRFGFREYSPEIGRWTAKDPIFFLGGMDLYGYCLNDPVNWVDPAGLRIQIMGDLEQKRYVLDQLSKFIRGKLSIDGNGILSRCSSSNDEGIESDIDKLIASDKLFRIFPYLNPNGWGSSETVITDLGADIYFDPTADANYRSGSLKFSPGTPASELAHELLGRGMQVQNNEPRGRRETSERYQSNQRAVQRANPAYLRMGMLPRFSYN
jgi:RHS repeat-associated protein